MRNISKYLKEGDKFWQNNQIINACHIKVYYYEMTMIKNLTTIILFVFSTWKGNMVEAES